MFFEAQSGRSSSGTVQAMTSARAVLASKEARPSHPAARRFDGASMVCACEGAQGRKPCYLCLGDGVLATQRRVGRR